MICSRFGRSKLEHHVPISLFVPCSCAAMSVPSPSDFRNDSPGPKLLLLFVCCLLLQDRSASSSNIKNIRSSEDPCFKITNSHLSFVFNILFTIPHQHAVKEQHINYLL